MRISNLRLERSGGAARASATVAWEEASRAPLELFYECRGAGADELSPEPEAFVTACMLPAMRDGERRVLVEGALCPEFSAGAAAAMSLLREWHGKACRPIALEGTGGLHRIPPRSPARAAVYLTGGVDSRHLVAERGRKRGDDSDRFADAFSLFGHLCADEPASRAWNDAVGPILASTAARDGLELVRMSTNSWKLAPDIAFLSTVSLSSALAAPAHLLRRRWSSIAIASCREAGSDYPSAFHPRLPPAFSSSALRIRHQGTPLSRDERLRVLAGEPGAIEDLVVCLAFPGPPHLNCGECEKCVRTMTGLVAIGALSRARRFPARDVSPDRIRAIPIRAMDEYYWLELTRSLPRVGRGDLVAVIGEKLEEMRRYESWARDEGWKGKLRRLDRRFFGGRLVEARKRLFS